MKLAARSCRPTDAPEAGPASGDRPTSAATCAGYHGDSSVEAERIESAHPLPCRSHLSLSLRDSCPAGSVPQIGRRSRFPRRGSGVWAWVWRVVKDGVAPRFTPCLLATELCSSELTANGVRRRKDGPESSHFRPQEVTMPTAPAGLHHVTAIATDPQRNADFYRFALGLRLVKKTVNFDSPTPITCISVTNQDSRAPLSPSSPGRGDRATGGALARPRRSRSRFRRDRWDGGATT